MPSLILLSWLFAFGLCIGSFLNVCIFRIPSKGSISDPPRSQCPQCGATIRFYDNIPVLSYLWLRGRCRHCSGGISPRYPIVEMLSGLFAVAVALRFGIYLEALFYYIFICTLLVIIFIDIDHQIIPDLLTLPGIVLFLAASFAKRSFIGYFPPAPAPMMRWAHSLSLPPMLFSSLLGILLGGGLLYLVAWGYFHFSGREGMGGGDIKLLAMIGAMIGWEGVVFTLFVGSATGTIVGILLMIGARLRDWKLRIPFGPFLSLGAIAYIFYGARAIHAYLLLSR